MKTVMRTSVRLLRSFGIFLYREEITPAAKLLRRIEDRLISRAGGILHIGAHFGQEAKRYSLLNVPVLWIEANPETYDVLIRTISHLPNQSARNFLLGDVDDTDVVFHLTSNDSASSSILQPKYETSKHFQLVGDLVLKMHRLDSVLTEVEAAKYRHWVIDVQGAELLVLTGAGDLLNHCQSLLIEAKRESFYQNGVPFHEIKDFLIRHGFINLWEVDLNAEENILFVRTGS